MKMTRQHIKALAAAMKASKPKRRRKHVDKEPIVYEIQFEQWERCVSCIMQTVSDSNTAFNATKFLEAVGMEKEG